MSASATQLSIAVAAGLIGYYLVYAMGVRLRLRRHEQRRSAWRGTGDSPYLVPKI